jgi:hypothetical protein
MSTREVSVAMPDALARGEDGRRLREALEDAVLDVWRGLGLPSTPAVTVQEAPGWRLGDVRVDRRPLPLSGRRRQRVTVAVTGSLREPSAPPTAEAFVRERYTAADPEQREALVAALVDAALTASIADLVAADAELLARSWLGAEGPVERAAEVLCLVGLLGLAPAQIDSAALEWVVRGGADDPHQACHDLVSSGARDLNPTLEMRPATLRRLTTSDRPFRPELIARGDPHAGTPRSIRAVALNAYGITLPRIDLAIAEDVPPDSFRVRFGPVRTPPELVLDDGCTAVEGVEGHPVPAAVVATYIDPIFGESWRVIDGSHAGPRTWHARFYDPAALVIRGLAAELQPRLSWWAPASVPELDWPDLMSGALFEQMSDRIGSVIRWLLAGTAPLQHSAPLLEGMAAALADGDRSTAGMVRRVRERLRAGAVGPMVSATDLEVVQLDDDAVAAALAAGSPEPLLGASPGLTDATGSVVVVCDAPQRARVGDLLFGLRDTIHVASRDEMRGAALAAAARAPEPVDVR